MATTFPATRHADQQVLNDLVTMILEETATEATDVITVNKPVWNRMREAGNGSVKTRPQNIHRLQDGLRYLAPDPLGFRGTIPSVFFMEYLTSKAVWIDRLSIRAIPEPSSFLLAACALLGLAGCGRRRRR